jgi:hypothetical protein
MMDVETNTTKWARLLAYVTGLVNQELLLQNEYLAAENRILKARLQRGWRLSDGERATLAEIGKRLVPIPPDPCQFWQDFALSGQGPVRARG